MTILEGFLAGATTLSGRLYQESLYAYRFAAIAAISVFAVIESTERRAHFGKLRQITILFGLPNRIALLKISLILAITHFLHAERRLSDAQ